MSLKTVNVIKWNNYNENQKFSIKIFEVIIYTKSNKFNHSFKNIQIGDRIPYVIIAGTKTAKNYEKVEDPIYVLTNDIPLDYDYYIEK